MADRFPLIVNTGHDQIQELPSGDNLNLSNNSIVGVTTVTATTVNATTITGDGSGLSGISGLGTALGSDSILENIFYLDKTLSINSNTTVNPPASASAAYTHFAEVKIEDGVELTIEDGDSLIIDVFGLDDT